MAALVDDPRLYKHLNEASLEAIFRKVSQTRVVSLFIPKREVWDKPDTRFPRRGLTRKQKYTYNSYTRALVEGVVGFHPEYVVDYDKVFVEVCAFYRYDKNEVNPYKFDVKRTVYRAYKQIFPPPDVLNVNEDMSNYSRPVRLLQEKLNENQFPFCFDISGAPDSVWIHDPKYPNLKNGISWEVRAYINPKETLDPKVKDFVQIKFRKLTHVDPEFIPNIPRPYLSTDRQYACHFGDGGAINLQSELDKYLYYFGDPIIVSIGVTNASNRIIKRIRVIAKQIINLQFWRVKEYTAIIQEKVITNEKLSIPILPRTDCWNTEVKLELSSGGAHRINTNVVVETPKMPSEKNYTDVLVAASTLHRCELDEFYHEKRLYVQPLDPSGIAKSDCPLDIRYQITVKCDIAENREHIQGESPTNVHDFLLCHPWPTQIPPTRIKEVRPY